MHREAVLQLTSSREGKLASLAQELFELGNSGKMFVRGIPYPHAFKRIMPLSSPKNISNTVA